jgi:carbon monoxide dehydrogenase subunit G
MAKFSSERLPVEASAETVYNKLSNLDNLRSLIANVPVDALPEDKRKMMESIAITSDSITVPAGPVGEIKLKMDRCESPRFISMNGEGTPVEVKIELEIEGQGEGRCMVSDSIDVAIPAMLKPMVSGPLQQAVDQFIKIIAAIPYNA